MFVFSPYPYTWMSFCPIYVKNTTVNYRFHYSWLWAEREQGLFCLDKLLLALSYIEMIPVENREEQHKGVNLTLGKHLRKVPRAFIQM